MRAITILGGGPGKAELSHHRGGCVHISRYHFKLNFKFHHTVNTVVELCNVTNATIPGGTLSLMKTLKVPCSVELINVTSPPFWVALHNVKKCHHERVDEWSHT
jgi:hypothetical protein